jgi:hypothetical protein
MWRSTVSSIAAEHSLDRLGGSARLSWLTEDDRLNVPETQTPRKIDRKQHGTVTPQLMCHVLILRIDDHS